MSNLAAKLNSLALLMICIAGWYVFSSVDDPGPPPEDLWFQTTVVDRVQPVVVKFGADWCGPCRMLDPELDRLERDLGGLVAVVRINVDEHRDLAAHYGVSAIPRLLLIHHGEVLADRTGYADHEQLQNWVVSQAQN
jgi:thioredoxin